MPKPINEMIIAAPNAIPMIGNHVIVDVVVSPPPFVLVVTPTYTPLAAVNQ